MALLGALAAALVSLCLMAAAQDFLQGNMPPIPASPAPPKALGEVTLLPSPRPQPRLHVLTPPARLHLPAVRPAIPPSVWHGASSNLLVVPAAPPTVPPGVYKTEPYSCIVVVPGPHPDDRCIINPGGREYPMPVINPDLRFIPLARK